MKLDVGCSDDPKGDVNVDFRTQEVDAFYKQPLQTYKNIQNFIKADAHHLPFKSKIFSESISTHTIEHVENPLKMVKEMKRVTYGIVKISTPLSFSYSYFSWLRPSGHKYWFLPYWFKNLGFETKINVKLLRPQLFDRKCPFWFPFFEIVACGSF